MSNKLVIYQTLLIINIFLIIFPMGAYITGSLHFNIALFISSLSLLLVLYLSFKTSQILIRDRKENIWYAYLICPVISFMALFLNLIFFLYIFGIKTDAMTP